MSAGRIGVDPCGTQKPVAANNWGWLQLGRNKDGDSQIMLMPAAETVCVSVEADVLPTSTHAAENKPKQHVTETGGQL